MAHFIRANGPLDRTYSNEYVHTIPHSWVDLFFYPKPISVYNKIINCWCVLLFRVQKFHKIPLNHCKIKSKVSLESWVLLQGQGHTPTITTFPEQLWNFFGWPIKCFYSTKSLWLASVVFVLVGNYDIFVVGWHFCNEMFSSLSSSVCPLWGMKKS